MIFTIVQAWGQLASAGRLTPFHAPIFSALVGVMGAAITYQIWRLYAFGKFASAALYASDYWFNNVKGEWNKTYEENPKAQWDHLLPLAKVSVYSEQMFRLNADKFWFRSKVLRLVDKKVTKRVRLNPWVLLLGFETSFGLSYGLLFGSIDWFLPEFVLLSMSLILFGYYFAWERKLRFWLRNLRASNSA